MGRFQDAVVIGARTVRRMPLPSGIYTSGLREARRPLPPGPVQKRHAIDLEMVDRTRVVWLDRHLADNGVIVHAPGGLFLSGPFRGDWQWVSRQADAHQCAAAIIDYRHAPDYQHPTALEDVEAVLSALGRRGTLQEGRWVMSGIDAGGALAVAACQRARDGGAPADARSSEQLPRPAALLLMSPWLDLTLSTTTLSEAAGATDPVHMRRLLTGAAAQYAGRTSLEAPELSPINGAMVELPPVHLSVGVKDILATDVRVLRMQLEEAGVTVGYREISGHLRFTAGMPTSGDAQRLYEEQARLIEGTLG